MSHALRRVGIRRRFEPRFPDVHPHRLRHTFAIATLERLVGGYYQQAAAAVKETDADAALVLYLSKADPLMLAGMCDSTRCPQATHHPCHRPVWEEHARTTAALVAGVSRRQNAERARLQTELARIRQVIDDIDAAQKPAPADEGAQR